jgi:dephospho-CoA kinase
VQSSKHLGPVRRFVLAGPIGSGKSVLGGMLQRRGALVIEADLIGHQILEPGEVAFPAVAARWPSAVVDGRIDRRRLASVVFADGNALRVLEALTHPHIAARVEARAAGAGERPVAVELPLVADILGEEWPRLVVLADAEVRLRRAVARGMEVEDVKRRMASQPTEARWSASADWVIRNDGSLDELDAEVGRWWAQAVAVRE